ncbi:ATP-grasp domain-containing protein [Kurthia massiliensis]|uniref:ATP-grasp domain-containing protein n=1 Tax=Kurthia massiliensis TaxID=1033739 RepID=UPI000287A6E6|nr:ATP-grasp domain-containing protein [Kurthia massiliensis]
MKKAYILYSAEDAKKNGAFITQLQQVGKQFGYTLTLLIEGQDDISTRVQDATFVWNRTRNASLAQQLEQSGIRVVNRSEVNHLANDKMRAAQFAVLQGVPTVPLILEQRLQSSDFPVVIKSTDGHGGTEVFKCDTWEAFEQKKQQFTHYVIQPYIETNATDVRVWMIGDEVIGAVKRIGATGDFRSNYTLGGTIEKFTLNTLQLKYVQQMQRALKSDYIGIDFLYISDEQLLFNEMEDPVGARSYYDLYDEDLVTKLWTHLTNTNDKKGPR